MTNQTTAAKDRLGLPTGLGVLEVPVSADVRCMVEYLRHGTAHDDAGTTAVVLLHDIGRDLDDHRSLAWSLFEAGFNVCNVDLPGHGMSSGGVPDIPAAIASTSAFVLADGANGIAYVVDGQPGAVVLSQSPTEAAALVMLHPGPGEEGAPPAPGWEYVPSLYVIDPTDTRSDDYAKELASASRAWNLRCFVHDDQPAEASPAALALDPDGSTWAVQSASLTQSFLLEQTFYWRLHHQYPKDETKGGVRA